MVSDGLFVLRGRLKKGLGKLPPKLMAPVSALLVMLRKLAKSSSTQPCWFALVDAFDFAGVPFCFVNQDVEFAGNGVEADQVAGTDFGDVAAHQGFGRHVDGGWNFAGRAGHTAVGQALRN